MIFLKKLTNIFFNILIYLRIINKKKNPLEY